MPGHTHFKCPDQYMWNVDEAGDLSPIVPIQDCLNCSLKRLDRACHYDFADLSARIEGTYTEVFSPSKMNGCLREEWFADRFDYWTNPEEQSRRVRGTAIHAGLEKVTNLDILGEARVYRFLYYPSSRTHVLNWNGGPVVISVQPDKVYPRLGMIHDDKTWQYLPVLKGKPRPVGYDYPKRGEAGVPRPRPGLVQVGPHRVDPDWQRQLTIGAWAWKDPLAVRYADGTWEHRPKPLDIREGQVSVRAQTNLRIPHIPLMADAEVEAWMIARVEAINAAKLSPEPPGYIEEKGRWKCRNCKVRYLCAIPKHLYEDR